MLPGEPGVDTPGVPWQGRVAGPPQVSNLPHKRPLAFFLEDVLEFSALLFVENLFDLGFAVAQYGAVILPEIVEDGFHLFLLNRSEIEFALHPVEIKLLTSRSVEG